MLNKHMMANSSVQSTRKSFVGSNEFMVAKLAKKIFSVIPYSVFLPFFLLKTGKCVLLSDKLIGEGTKDDKRRIHETGCGAVGIYSYC